MKRTNIIIFFIAINIILHGQNDKKKIYNYKMLQGVWQMEFNYNLPNEGSFYNKFYIIKKRKMIIIKTNTPPLHKLNVVVYKYGFSNSVDANDIWKMQVLQDSGRFFIAIEENAEIYNKCFLSVSNIVQVTEKQYLNVFNDECMYLTEAPKEVLKIMYIRGKHDKRDYIKEFLYIDVRGIKAEKTYIYDSTENKTEKFLLKNDIVTVIGKQNDFLIIKYEIPKGKITDALRPKSEIIIGLVKKEDVDLPIND